MNCPDSIGTLVTFIRYFLVMSNFATNMHFYEPITEGLGHRPDSSGKIPLLTYVSHQQYHYQTAE